MVSSIGTSAATRALSTRAAVAGRKRVLGIGASGAAGTMAAARTGAPSAMPRAPGNLAAAWPARLLVTMPNHTERPTTAISAAPVAVRSGPSLDGLPSRTPPPIATTAPPSRNVECTPPPRDAPHRHDGCIAVHRIAEHRIVGVEVQMQRRGGGPHVEGIHPVVSRDLRDPSYRAVDDSQAVGCGRGYETARSPRSLWIVDRRVVPAP